LSKPTTLERRLALWAPSCRVTAAVRKHAAAAYGLGGLHGLALWLQARARLSRLSPVEMQELRELARVLVRQAAPIRKALTEQLKTAAEQQVPASLSWEQRQQLLAQREAQRRAGDRQQVTLVPANRVDSPAPIPSGPSYCRKAKGECGARLAVKLDRLLVEIQGAPPPAAAAVAAAGDQPGGARSTERSAQSLAAAAFPAQSPEGRTAEIRPCAEGAEHQLPPAAGDQPEAVVAPAPRKRAPRGTCCPRELELPLTLLLQQIHHHEDEADWPEDPEFPWELAIETLEATAAGDQPEERGAPPAGAAPSATVAHEPAMAESATAELQPPAEPEGQSLQIGDRRQPGPEAANPAVAGDLADPPGIAASPAPEGQSRQPELAAAAESATAAAVAQPLPVSIHALEAAWAAEPAAAAAVAELSPRARAIAELGAALLQGGQSITLSPKAAAELLEALV